MYCSNGKAVNKGLVNSKAWLSCGGKRSRSPFMPFTFSIKVMYRLSTWLDGRCKEPLSYGWISPCVHENPAVLPVHLWSVAYCLSHGNVMVLWIAVAVLPSPSSLPGFSLLSFFTIAVFICWSLCEAMLNYAYAINRLLGPGSKIVHKMQKAMVHTP